VNTQAITIFDQAILNHLDKARSFLYDPNIPNEILFRTSSIFPLDLFPDEITIDKFKICVKSKNFFSIKDIHYLTIDSIKDIEVIIGPFFASLIIYPTGINSEPMILKNLSKNSAITCSRIIEGLLVLTKQGIKAESLIQDNALVKRLEKLGRSHFSDDTNSNDNPMMKGGENHV
jgi:hypothetical protein